MLSCNSVSRSFVGLTIATPTVAPKEKCACTWLPHVPDCSLFATRYDSSTTFCSFYVINTDMSNFLQWKGSVNTIGVASGIISSVPKPSLTLLFVVSNTIFTPICTCLPPNYGTPSLGIEAFQAMQEALALVSWRSVSFESAWGSFKPWIILSFSWIKAFDVIRKRKSIPLVTPLSKRALLVESIESTLVWSSAACPPFLTILV